MQASLLDAISTKYIFLINFAENFPETLDKVFTLWYNIAVNVGLCGRKAPQRPKFTKGGYLQ